MLCAYSQAADWLNHALKSWCIGSSATCGSATSLSCSSRHSSHGITTITPLPVAKHCTLCISNVSLTDCIHCRSCYQCMISYMERDGISYPQGSVNSPTPSIVFDEIMKDISGISECPKKIGQQKSSSVKRPHHFGDQILRPRDFPHHHASRLLYDHHMHLSPIS